MHMKKTYKEDYFTRRREGFRAAMTLAKWPPEPPVMQNDLNALSTSPSLCYSVSATLILISARWLIFIYLLWLNQPKIKIYLFIA